MGMYLNSISPYYLYKSEFSRPYFVDKSEVLKELIPFVFQGNSYICVTRPRRFGKTVMANMIGAFFGKGEDASEIFDNLKISQEENYRNHLNQHNVIYIDFSVVDDECTSYKEYIEAIKETLKSDLHLAYPDVAFREKSSVREDLTRIFTEKKERFLFVLDEWDAVFHMPFIKEEDKQSYLLFLKGLLKDKPYVSLAYMTGILPIAKYSSGSELNMFIEYTMGTEAKFGDDFGFSDAEVDMLYQRFIKNCEEKGETPAVTREGLRYWYDGYYTKSGEKMYNPRSVAASLSNNNLGSYWTSSGPYDEIFYYVEHNVADVRKDLALMVAGEGVTSKIQEYAATSMNLSTREEILSAMVVYGFLSYYKGKVYIPNKELMDKFDEMLRKEPSLGYVYQLAKESERMLQATLHGDTETMEEILAFAHNTETPLLSYNNETELSAIVNLVYLSARDRYRVEREDKAGTGFVDFIFYPEEKGDTGIILELKIDHTPEEAIKQIRDKQYVLRFKGKLGEKPKVTGRILAVGISYDRKTKEHHCKVEDLQ
ncbi:MAG: AAA family ATPase [Clostridia bacterium]|nr:AAA family ATPase [Clostridia bacterium]